MVETTPRSSNETDSGVEKLIPVHLLQAQEPQAFSGKNPDSADEIFHKGRKDAEKPPCHKRKSSLPGHVDGLPAEPDLGITPEVSAEPSTSPTTTTSFSTSTSTTQSSTPPQTLPASTPRQGDSAEPEKDLPNRAVPGNPDPAIDAAAEGVQPEGVPASTLPPTTSLPKPPRIHEAWRVFLPCSVLCCRCASSLRPSLYLFNVCKHGVCVGCSPVLVWQETWPIQYEDGEWAAERGPRTESGLD